MNIELLQTKMVSGDPDLSFEIGEKARQWAAKVSDSNMLMFKVIERMRFFYPTSPNFRGYVTDLKFITYPGEGYVPNLPGSIFDTPSTFKLDIYMDMTPYICLADLEVIEDTRKRKRR
ncbi:uncharacterized protein isoform X2 [Rhodnius prolixus]|uniref:uncharacterized protein isoform X2 n=1 Tax=Rhodnius prolixus TaxID=13249 RepID=UPI003D18894D